MFDGEKFARYIKDSGLTNAAMARRLGISEGAVRHIIVGVKQPSLYMAYEISRMMGCSVDALLKCNRTGQRTSGGGIY